MANGPVKITFTFEDDRKTHTFVNFTKSENFMAFWKIIHKIICKFCILSCANAGIPTRAVYKCANFGDFGKVLQTEYLVFSIYMDLLFTLLSVYYYLLFINIY